MTDRIRHIAKTLLLPALLSTILSGCWDVVDIEKRDLVTGLALDLTADGELLLTAQLPIAKLMVPTADDRRDESKFYTLSAKGSSTLAAFDQFKLKTSGFIDTLKTKVLIIGEKVAVEGVTPYLDTIGRMPKFPADSNLMISRTDPGQLLKYDVTNLTLPSFYLLNFFEAPSKKGAVYPMKLWRFFYKLDNPGIDPFLPVLDYSTEEKVFLPAGIAAFTGDRLAAYLTPEETILFGLLSGNAENFLLSTKWREERITTLRYGKGRVVYQWLPPNTIKINIKSDGYMMEETGATLPLTPKHIVGMEAALEEKVKIEAEKLLRRLQEIDSDILGLGRVVRAHHYGKWSEEYWRDLYPKLQIKISVDFTITRTGLLS